MAGNHNSGRKALPANVHQLTGNRGKKAAADLKDAARPEVEIPDAPDFLTEEALREWERVCPLLQKMGLISGMYRAPLAAYCQAWGRYVHAETKIKELGDKAMVETTPSGYKQMGVWLQVSNRAAAEMKSFAAEFGMTPAAISRVTGAAPQGDLFGYGDTPKKEGAGRFF